MEILSGRERSPSLQSVQYSGRLWMAIAVFLAVASVISWLWPVEPLLAISLPDRYLAPGSLRSDGLRSWLGTDSLGRDLLASLAVGTPHALLIGLLSAGASAILALLIGVLVAHYRDGIRVSVRSLVLGSLCTIALIYGLWYRDLHPSLTSLCALFIAVLLVINWLLSRSGLLTRTVQLSIDHIFLVFAEVFRAVPALLMMLVIVSIWRLDQSRSLIGLIVFFLWVSMARIVRAEALSIREKDYLASGEILGYSTVQLIWRHYAPNVLPALLVAASYAMAAAIILEATLSFLGIYAPQHQSWGAQLQGARDNIAAWWLAVYPGLMIFLVLTMAQSFAAWIRSER